MPSLTYWRPATPEEVAENNLETLFQNGQIAQIKELGFRFETVHKAGTPNVFELKFHKLVKKV